MLHDEAVAAVLPLTIQKMKYVEAQRKKLPAFEAERDAACREPPAEGAAAAAAAANGGRSLRPRRAKAA
jgi:hypothetical protein